jgi:hypothetical protein
LATESEVLGEILFMLQPSWRQANVVGEYYWRTLDSEANLSPRTADSVDYPSQLRISEKYLHPKHCFSENSKPKILQNWRTTGSVANPSLRS